MPGFALGGNLAPQNQQAFLGFNPLLLQQLVQLRAPGYVEHTFDDRFPGAGAYRLGRGALAQQQRERTDDDGFARAGFAGQRVQPTFRRTDSRSMTAKFSMRSSSSMARV